MKWKIKNLTIKNQTVLAPMAGICDSAFRTIIKSMGCGLIETEMVSDKAITHNNQKTKKMLMILAENAPQTPNMSKLYAELETDRNQGLKMLKALSEAGLLTLLRRGC